MGTEWAGIVAVLGVVLVAAVVCALWRTGVRTDALWRDWSAAVEHEDAAARDRAAEGRSAANSPGGRARGHRLRSRARRSAGVR